MLPYWWFPKSDVYELFWLLQSLLLHAVSKSIAFEICICYPEGAATGVRIWTPPIPVHYTYIFFISVTLFFRSQMRAVRAISVAFAALPAMYKNEYSICCLLLIHWSNFLTCVTTTSLTTLVYYRPISHVYYPLLSITCPICLQYWRELLQRRCNMDHTYKKKHAVMGCVKSGLNHVKGNTIFILASLLFCREYQCCMTITTLIFSTLRIRLCNSRCFLGWQFLLTAV